MTTRRFEDYPLEPSLRGKEHLFEDGFEKLRCLEDRVLARSVFERLVYAEGKSMKNAKGWKPTPAPEATPESIAEQEEIERRFR